MLPVTQAESIILNLVQPIQETERINLEAANNRILAQVVTSELDFPYWDNSAMDGYAVKFDDVKNCSENQPTILEIVEEISAGVQPKITIKSGEASRIFTGAMLPEGADTIIIQENTKREGNKVQIFQPAKAPQAFLRQRGSFYQAGNPLLLPGIAIHAPEIAVLATAQCSQVTVYRLPRIAIFSTGDELVAPNQPLEVGKIVDSNQYALAAFVASQGGMPMTLGIVSDNRDLLQEKMSQSINSADFVLSTGGVSVGDYDYVEEILAELGGEIYIRSVAIKPGKPLTVAKFSNGCVYFGIPGNPVSALVSCWRFVQPALKKLSGLKENWQPSLIKAISRQALTSNGKRETYLWGKLKLVEGIYYFELANGSQNSANLINLAQTNALAILPVETMLLKEGDLVEVMLTI